MRVLCNYTPCGPSFVRSGWGRVFEALGHSFRFWDQQHEAAFDVFGDFEPDLYLGTTYETDRAIVKCISARPQMKVALYASAWGPYLNDVDLKKYPIVVASEQEKGVIERLKKETGKPDLVFIHAHGRWLDGTMSGWRDIGCEPLGMLNAADTFVYLGGQYRAELKSDVAFVGGYWGYKARNLDRYILPMCRPNWNGLDVKIFGNQPWPVHQYLGFIDDNLVKDVFASARVCPNVSEPHSTDLGWDVIERPFKILCAGGFCISDSVEEADDLFDELELPTVNSPKEMEEYCMFFADDTEDVINKVRQEHIEAGKKKVLAHHTYFDRVADLLTALGLGQEGKRVLDTKVKHLEGHI